MRTRTVLAVLLSCSLAFAACGGDDDDDSSSNTDATTDSGSGDSDSDQAKADAAIDAFGQQAEDEGFTAASDDESTESDDESDGAGSEFEFESEECQQFAAAFASEKLDGETAKAESSSYEKGDLTTSDSAESIEADVTFVDDAATLDGLFDMLDDDQLAPCVEEAFQQSFAADDGDPEAPDLGISDLSAQELETTGLGDGSKALGVTATVSALGASFPVVSQFEFVKDGRAAITVIITAIGAETVTADRTALAQAMVEAL